MRRRSKAAGRLAKAPRRKAVAPKRRKEPKAERRNKCSVGVLEEKPKRQARELGEARDERAAIEEVLRVVSSSPGTLEPVFAAILKNATRICEANFGTLYLKEEDAFRSVAMHNVPPAFADARRREPLIWPSPSNPMVRVAATKRPLQIRDVSEDLAWPRSDPQFGLFAGLTGARSLVVVPMLKDDTLIGVITVCRIDAQAFTQEQIDLLLNFVAAQAVIAIENTRPLSELRQRTDDLTASLEQQIGTSEILRVISSSPTNVQPVLDTIVRTAVNLCNSYDAVILVREGEQLRIAAHYGPMALDFERLPLGRDFVSGRTVIDGVPVHVPDFMAAGVEFPRGREVAKRLRQRTVLGLPLRREGHTIGCLFLRRTEVLPFTDKQVELLTTFADQAVIAIENVRLFEAEQQRTHELIESLEQQTATSEVLRIVATSPQTVQPGFRRDRRECSSSLRGNT